MNTKKETINKLNTDKNYSDNLRPSGWSDIGHSTHWILRKFAISIHFSIKNQYLRSKFDVFEMVQTGIDRPILEKKSTLTSFYCALPHSRKNSANTVKKVKKIDFYLFIFL